VEALSAVGWLGLDRGVKLELFITTRVEESDLDDEDAIMHEGKLKEVEHACEKKKEDKKNQRWKMKLSMTLGTQE
jgi:hypothetical protein